MKTLMPRRRLAMLFSCIGIALMGADLLITRSVFIHIGELMAASILFLVTGLLLDRPPNTSKGSGKSPEAPGGSHK